jgi:predicted  nucleic acid-binding Zn-ribbon protein
MVNREIQNIEDRINELSNKVITIESKISRIDKSKDWDYQKVLSAIKYLYRYYDDMTKDKETEIT